MTFAARNDEVMLALGHSTARVRCRPSLRAATHFVRKDGFADLPRSIAEFNLGTIRDLIDNTATDRQEASAFLDQIVRRQGFWDNRRRELTEALAHQGFDIRRPLLDEASGAV